MRLLALLHRLGVNPAMAAGLLLMPAVVATGYLVDRVHEHFVIAGDLRGSMDGSAADGRRATLAPF